jgi:hypothetical protein
MGVLTGIVDKYPEALRKMNKSSQSPFLFHCHTMNRSRANNDWGQLEFP